MNDYIFTFAIHAQGETEEEAWEEVKQSMEEKVAKNQYDTVEKLL